MPKRLFSRVIEKLIFMPSRGMTHALIVRRSGPRRGIRGAVFLLRRPADAIPFTPGSLPVTLAGEAKRSTRAFFARVDRQGGVR